ncbi:hypothetical protein COJ46_21885 [Bacillus sp. AFS077874]|uniref:helix-turn-helix domain-containing protein n=1 Tax=unclassified Bacillus (in: firmicutes) TaxID=185979 RepID=UPI000BFA1493|nr:MULTISPECIES: helix-turn-helix transcriptional regulator [unclassified Bacillus (in: firmicutes)]PET71581.1 hypothetical protein CN514_06630 [Bacillus sp. AFS001701]PFM75316.1 hypothetical protein COJ46_21885 [Bacillus sp. AFS077874]
MSIKERIISKRKELGLNQTELAKKSGLQPPAISQYESGIRNPSYDALVKLSNALNVTIDYLVSGVKGESNSVLEPKSEVLIKIFQNLNSQKREKLMNDAFSYAGYENVINYFSIDPKNYAKYVFDQLLKKEFPIDVYILSDKISLKIINGDLKGEAEAILLKKNNTIILDQKVTHEARVKFALATLIGHLLIPWHTNDVYYYRKSGKSTLLTEITDEMEASLFATNLITPSEILEKDLSNLESKNISLKDLKILADEKYKVSLTSFCNRLIEYNKDRFAVVNSSEFKITKIFSGNMLIKEVASPLNKDSKAFELLSNPGQEEELKEGIVNANTWIDEADENEMLYESSIFNPKYNSTLTLLTRINK